LEKLSTKIVDNSEKMCRTICQQEENHRCADLKAQ
jgi:hypothetical protein